MGWVGVGWEEILVLLGRFELPACRLRIGCSAAELQQRGRANFTPRGGDLQKPGACDRIPSLFSPCLRTSPCATPNLKRGERLAPSVPAIQGAFFFRIILIKSNKHGRFTDKRWTAPVFGRETQEAGLGHLDSNCWTAPVFGRETQGSPASRADCVRWTAPEFGRETQAIARIAGASGGWMTPVFGRETQVLRRPTSHRPAGRHPYLAGKHRAPNHQPRKPPAG